MVFKISYSFQNTYFINYRLIFKQKINLTRDKYFYNETEIRVAFYDVKL